MIEETLAVGGKIRRLYNSVYLHSIYREASALGSSAMSEYGTQGLGQ